MYSARHGTVFNLEDLRNLVTSSELWDWNECSQAAEEEYARVTIPTELSFYASKPRLHNEQQKQQLYQWSLGISARASEKRGMGSGGGHISPVVFSLGPSLQDTFQPVWAPAEGSVASQG